MIHTLKRRFSSYIGPINFENLNPNLIKSQYAVGGPVPKRAVEIKKEML